MKRLHTAGQIDAVFDEKTVTELLASKNIVKFMDNLSKIKNINPKDSYIFEMRSLGSYNWQYSTSLSKI